MRACERVVWSGSRILQDKLNGLFAKAVHQSLWQTNAITEVTQLQAGGECSLAFRNVHTFPLGLHVDKSVKLEFLCCIGNMETCPNRFVLEHPGSLCVNFKNTKIFLLSHMFSSFYLYVFILWFSPLKVVKKSWYYKVYFLDFTEAVFNLCSNSGYKNTPLVLIETNSRGNSSDTWWDFRWESSWRLGSDLKRKCLCNWLEHQME